jgi:hypothetical protein
MNVTLFQGLRGRMLFSTDVAAADYGVRMGVARELAASA